MFHCSLSQGVGLAARVDHPLPEPWPLTLVPFMKFLTAQLVGVEGASIHAEAYITIAIRLRYDYDTTTTKNWHVNFFARVESRRMEAGTL